MTSSNSSSSSSSSSSSAPTPLEAASAPAGAYLGQTSGGNTLVSQGGGSASVLSPSGENLGTVSLTDSGSGAAAGGAAQGATISESQAAGSSLASGGTTVSQAAGGDATDGSESTNIDGTTRTDFSPVLAAQLGLRKSRAPYISNNYVSLYGGEGGLGRRGNESKRTLIGGQ